MVHIGTDKNILGKLDRLPRNFFATEQSTFDVVESWLITHRYRNWSHFLARGKYTGKPIYLSDIPEGVKPPKEPPTW